MNNQTTQNVARLMNQETVFKHIQSFLRNKGVKSENTEKAYENDIRQFFLYMRNKKIENLTEQDIYFKNSDMMDYRTYLYREFVQPNGKRYSNVTINRKVNTIIALYGFLKKNGYSVDPDLLKLDDELPDDSKQIGFLTVDEVDYMLLLTNDKELKYFIMLALRTSSRKDALLSLNWEQIKPCNNNPECFIITTYDKGKYIDKEIHKSMYELLLELKQDDEMVFHIPIRTLDYRFKALCKKAGIDEKRNVSIHSLKKAGVSYVKELTNDLHAAQMQAGHSSPVTTSKYYVEKQRNLAGMALDMKIDSNILDQLTHEECLKVLRSFGNGIGHQLKLAAKKIIDTRR